MVLFGPGAPEAVPGSRAPDGHREREASGELPHGLPSLRLAVEAEHGVNLHQYGGPAHHFHAVSGADQQSAEVYPDVQSL